MNGVARCIVGYCGGIEPDPSYDHMKDFTESVFIEFDPTVVKYEDILKEWSQMDYPYVKCKLQHRSALFILDDDQERVARSIIQWIIDEKAEGQPVYTDVVNVTKFYRAEEYHQDFIAKRRELRASKQQI